MIKGFFIVDIGLQVQIVFILTKKKKKNRIILAPALAFSFYRPCHVEELGHKFFNLKILFTLLSLHLLILKALLLLSSTYIQTNQNHKTQ